MTPEEEAELDAIAEACLYSDYDPTIVDHILAAGFWIVFLGLGLWWVMELLP